MTSRAFSAGLGGQGGCLESSSLFSKCALVLLGLLRGGRGFWEATFNLEQLSPDFFLTG